MRTKKKSDPVHFHLSSVSITEIVTKIREVHVPFGSDVLLAQFGIPSRHPVLSLVDLEMAGPTIGNNNSLREALQRAHFV